MFENGEIEMLTANSIYYTDEYYEIKAFAEKYGYEVELAPLLEKYKKARGYVCPSCLGKGTICEKYNAYPSGLPDSLFGEDWRYRDYWKLLKQTAHSQKEDYWRYPKDLQRKHDELLAEVENIKQMEEIEQLKAKQKMYFKAVKKLLKYGTEIDGYSVFIPGTVEEVAEQAMALHQCLIANDYVSKVISRSCVLVFIQKDRVPVATCQL